MSRPPHCASDHAHWKSMPPGSDVYEQVLEDLLQSSCSSSSSLSSDSSSSTSCSCCACTENCPDRYCVSAAAELRDDHGRNLDDNLQRRLNLGQSQDYLDPGQIRFDGIARSRSWSPRPDLSQVTNSPAAGRPNSSRDGHSSASAALEKKGKVHSAILYDQRRDQGIQTCNFVEDLNRQTSAHHGGTMGNNITVPQEKRLDHRGNGNGDGHHPSDAFASKKHKTLPPISGKEKSRTSDVTAGSSDSRLTSSHMTGNNGHVSPSGGNTPGSLAATGHIVTSPELKTSRSGSDRSEGTSPQGDHRTSSECNQRDSAEKDVSSYETDHSHASLFRLYPRPGTPRGRLSPLPQRISEYDNVDSSAETSTGPRDDQTSLKGEEGRCRTRHGSRNGSQAQSHQLTSPKPPRDSAALKLDRSPSSSPVPIPQLHNLHELGSSGNDHCSAVHAQKCQQHVRLCTHNYEGIPSISIDEAEDDRDHFRPRSMSDASVLHVRRRRQLPRPPLHAHRKAQDDEHVHVHWADEERGSPLATSVLLTSIRPRALSHGSVDMPKKPILKKPYGF